EGTGRSYNARFARMGSGPECLLYLVHTSLVHPFAGFLLDPHQSSAGSTTHAVFAALFHLYDLESWNSPQHLSWGIVHTIVAPQIAGIVVSDQTFERN